MASLLLPPAGHESMYDGKISQTERKLPDEREALLGRRARALFPAVPLLAITFAPAREFAAMAA